ncbi:hypothetical protein [Granulibacter bethesdensis]|uniref:hypothetical protein n=1 Tax=Granulibacter bethesdensis TaxID=364410 RepID=UPI001C12C7B1|nr:hypothetical protein [Granulibacter bethesdensis]
MRFRRQWQKAWGDHAPHRHLPLWCRRNYAVGASDRADAMQLLALPQLWRRLGVLRRGQRRDT